MASHNIPERPEWATEQEITADGDLRWTRPAPGLHSVYGRSGQYLGTVDVVLERYDRAIPASDDAGPRDLIVIGDLEISVSQARSLALSILELVQLATT